MAVLLFLALLQQIVSADILPAVSLLPRLDITLPSVPAGACARDARLVEEGLRDQSLWAMRMWDATAQGASGAIYGNNWQLGDFDECTTHLGAPIQTQYCLLLVQNNISSKGNGDVGHYIQETIRDRRWLRRDMEHPGICVPASCTPQDLQVSLTAQMGSYNDTDVSYSVTVIPDLCTNIDDAVPWTANEICFAIFCCLFLLASICGTLIPTSGSMSSLLSCFSLTQNAAILFDVRPEGKGSSYFAVFHAVKAISMACIIVGHRGSLPISGAVANYQNVEDAQQGVNRMLFLHADLVVDTFFFVSALLATNSLCKAVSAGRLNLFQVAIARIIRLAPAYYMLVWYQSSISHRLGSGPLWNFIQKSETEACQNYWWANLLFINNYFPANLLCMVHSWYLGCDVHFFLLTLVLTPLLVKRPNFAKWLLGALIVLTSIAPALTVYFSEGLDPLLVYFEHFHINPRNSNHLSLLYNPSHTRVTVYIMGMATGYFTFLKQDSKYKIPKIWLLIGIVVSLVVMWIPMGLGGTFYAADYEISRFYSAFYAGVRRPLFGVSLVMLFLLHRFAGKDYFAWVSSNQIIVVPSRLCFTIYLVHFPLILWDWASVRHPVTFSLFYMAYKGIADMTFSSIVAVVIYLLIEMPVKRVFQEVVFARKRPKEPVAAPKPESMELRL